MSDEDICYLSATEALNRFRRRKLSPVELMQAVIERAERLEPAINAFTATFYERALEQAKKAEAKYMRKRTRLRVLEGLPLAIKDEVPVKGDPITSGSLVHKDDVATETAVFACRAGGARPCTNGAVVYGRYALWRRLPLPRRALPVIARGLCGKRMPVIFAFRRTGA